VFWPAADLFGRIRDDECIAGLSDRKLLRSRLLLPTAGIAEFSVYVTRPHRGSGAGRVAFAALIDAAAKAGFWKLVSCIFPENTASLALRARMSFRQIGVYQRHGRLDGQWRD